MTVWVDQFRKYGTRTWCHMWSPNVEELHDMADKIGLKRSWFQDNPRHPHYDIYSVLKRKQAIGFGAVSCSSAELVQKMLKERK